MRIIQDEEQTQLIEDIHKTYQDHLIRMKNVKSRIDSIRIKKRRPKKPKAVSPDTFNDLAESGSPNNSLVTKAVETQLQSAFESGPLPKKAKVRKVSKTKKQLNADATKMITEEEAANVKAAVILAKFSVLYPWIYQRPGDKNFLNKAHPTSVATTFRNISAQRERMLVEVVRDNEIAEQPLVRLNYSIPNDLMLQYLELTNTLDTSLVAELLRPRIFINVNTDNRDFGRIIFQLFTEACPAVVLKFIECVARNHFKNIEFKRMFAKLWIESELTLEKSGGDYGNDNAPMLEHSLNVLNHRCGSGVLSFPVRHVLGGYQSKTLPFTISLKPLDVLYGQRVAFGVVRRGHWVLDQLQAYASKSGKMTQHVYITSCGLL